MCNSAIEEIYFCDRAYCEERIDTEEFEQAKREFTAAYDKLLKLLPEDLKGSLDDVFLLHSGVADAGYAKKFKDGFKLGFKIAVEIYSGK